MWRRRGPTDLTVVAKFLFLFSFLFLFLITLCSKNSYHPLPAKRKPLLDLGPRGGLRAAFSRGLEIHRAANITLPTVKRVARRMRASSLATPTPTPPPERPRRPPVIDR